LSYERLGGSTKRIGSSEPRAPALDKARPAQASNRWGESAIMMPGVWRVLGQGASRPGPAPTPAWRDISTAPSRCPETKPPADQIP